MRFTGAELTAWIGSYLWPFFRIGAAVAAIPAIGSRIVPVRVRLALALALTLVVVPVIPRPPAVDPLSPQAVLLIGQQLLIGIAMGFALHLVFSAFVHAGQIVAMQMGLGFASMVDPQNGVQVPVLSQFYAVVVTLMFLVLDGHLALIEALAESFRLLPISAAGIAAAGFWDLAEWAGRMFGWAVSIALPAITALFLVNVAFGVMMRAAPQLNIFVVGFPMSMILGFVVILLALPGLLTQFEALLADGFTLMRAVFAGRP